MNRLILSLLCLLFTGILIGELSSYEFNNDVVSIELLDDEEERESDEENEQSIWEAKLTSPLTESHLVKSANEEKVAFNYFFAINSADFSIETPPPELLG